MFGSLQARLVLFYVVIIVVCLVLVGLEALVLLRGYQRNLVYSRLSDRALVASAFTGISQRGNNQCGHYAAPRRGKAGLFIAAVHGRRVDSPLCTSLHWKAYAKALPVAFWAQSLMGLRLVLHRPDPSSRAFSISFSPDRLSQSLIAQVGGAIITDESHCQA
jgi:hypothetical protein